MPEFALTHRTYHARAGSDPHPGLLLLHGRGADENDLLPLAAELDPRLFVVSARAPFQFPWGGYMWYDLDPQGVGYPDARTFEPSLELLRRFLAQILEHYPIDSQCLYLGGFSMGAVMSATLALLQPERIAGAIVLSGYLPSTFGLPFQPERAAGHPFFVAHGTLDPVIPIQFGRLGRDYLAQTPVDLTYHEYPTGHEISLPELQDLARWLTTTLDARPIAPSPPGTTPDSYRR